MQMPEPLFLNPKLYTLSLSLAIPFACMKVMNTTQWEKMLCNINPNIMHDRLKTVDLALYKSGKKFWDFL